jgi:hypothetical protein
MPNNLPAKIKMKNLLSVALTFCVAALAMPVIAQTPQATTHRGSIQIQGSDITQNYRNGQGTISFSWAQSTPLTKKEGRQQLAILENMLTAAQKKDRREGLDMAITYINRCPDNGCEKPVQRNFPPGKEKRVDIVVDTGFAFTGTPPQ